MDEHFPRVELGITIDEFHRLPRNAAYKYEYFGGRAVLTPRPKAFTAVRELCRVERPPGYDLRPLPAGEITALESLFRAAVAQTQPFASLPETEARRAARECLLKTATGGDGPLVESACFQAFTPRSDAPTGAILVTLQPLAVGESAFARAWEGSPPADAITRRLGCPHLTWVFVSPWERQNGIASALLAAASNALAEMGFNRLASTFLLDNGPSILWHWRNGFRLLPIFSAIRDEAVRRVRPRN